MGRELQWDVKTMHNELHSCLAFMRHFGGTKPVSRHTDDVISGSRVSREELLEVFRKLNLAGREYLTEEQIPLVSFMFTIPTVSTYYTVQLPYSILAYYSTVQKVIFINMSLCFTDT